jgi:hypothetical protein
VADQQWVSCYRDLDGGAGRYHPYVCTVSVWLLFIFDTYWRGVTCSRGGPFLARESKVGMVTKVVEKDVQLYLCQGTNVSRVLIVDTFGGFGILSVEVTELQATE